MIYIYFLIICHANYLHYSWLFVFVLCVWDLPAIFIYLKMDFLLNCRCCLHRKFINPFAIMYCKHFLHCVIWFWAVSGFLMYMVRNFSTCTVSFLYSSDFMFRKALHSPELEKYHSVFKSLIYLEFFLGHVVRTYLLRVLFLFGPISLFSNFISKCFFLFPSLLLPKPFLFDIIVEEDAFISNNERSFLWQLIFVRK